MSFGQVIMNKKKASPYSTFNIYLIYLRTYFSSDLKNEYFVTLCVLCSHPLFFNVFLSFSFLEHHLYGHHYPGYHQ